MPWHRYLDYVIRWPLLLTAEALDIQKHLHKLRSINFPHFNYLKHSTSRWYCIIWGAQLSPANPDGPDRQVTRIRHGSEYESEAQTVSRKVNGLGGSIQFMHNGLAKLQISEELVFLSPKTEIPRVWHFI